MRGTASEGQRPERQRPGALSAACLAVATLREHLFSYVPCRRRAQRARTAHHAEHLRRPTDDDAVGHGEIEGQRVALKRRAANYPCKPRRCRDFCLGRQTTCDLNSTARMSGNMKRVPVGRQRYDELVTSALRESKESQAQQGW